MKVSDADVHDVLRRAPDAVPAAGDPRGASTSSSARTKALAESIYTQLKGGADFAALAKKYSQDPARGPGRQATPPEGPDVAPFDKVAFAAEDERALEAGARPQYGWFVIKALAPIKPAEHDAREAGGRRRSAQQLLQTKQNEAMNDWVDRTSEELLHGRKIEYQVGYAPSPDPCARCDCDDRTTTAG